MKEINGCEKESSVGERWEIGPYKLMRCPLRILTNEGLELLVAYKFYKAGFFPAPGGWLSQSEKLIEAIQVLDSELIEIEKRFKKDSQR